ncbi:MAG: glycoside hydrolase family 3 N-terminal domain-containing protein [Bacteroidota bacterium]
MFFKKIIFFSIIALFFSLTHRNKHTFKNKKSKIHAIPEFAKSDNAWAKSILKSMTLEEKIAQFFMVATWSNKNEEHQAEIENLIKNQKIGGLIYFQGTQESMKTSISRFQGVSKTPLLIGMDAEWGIAMRLNEAERFPYAYTIGAANDTILSEKLGAMIAQECKEMGVHINFAPVADVNSNSENPVIGFRSFGENSLHVSKHVAAMVRGMEKNGILTSIKHFPGHGDTDKDSHLELPTVSHSKEQFETIDFLPFEAGIKAGASSVMVGHLNVPNLDNSDVPSSLSKTIIQDYLKKNLNFKGLVISDALNMKAVADKYGKIDVVVKAFEAGNDILLFPENVEDAINAIAKKVQAGEISEADIDERCLKILNAKHHAMNHKATKIYTKGEIEWAKKDCYEKAFTLAKNANNALPLTNVNSKIAIVNIGVKTAAFKEMVRKFHEVDVFHFYSFEEASERMKVNLSKYDVVITSIHAKSVTANANFSTPGKLENWLVSVPEEKNHVLVLFGNPNLLKETKLTSNFDALFLAYENHQFSQEQAAQLLFGAIGANGKIPFKVSDEISLNSGIELKDAKRLKFSQPEELNINPTDLERIDALVQKGISAKAFPGCQVLVAIKGKIIYQKSFGTITYEDTTPVNNNIVYDIASVSKIVGSTAGLMRLQTQGKFSLNKQLKDYIPELVENYPVGNILLKNMMAHQAGFTPWIAFYKQTVNYGVPNFAIYSNTKKTNFEVLVAKDLWIRNDYEKVIYKTILQTPLTRKPKYEYSDLGYYFAKKLIEKQSGLSLDNFMYQEFYDPMGLKNMRYLPLLHFPTSKIAPTESDSAFRTQIVHGFVHDPGAAMLGGVGGHAGIFSNSQDLAAMMQLFLNKGFYGNREYISPEVVKEFTSVQLKGNRRGAGFDKPTANKKAGPTCSLVSSESFGHSGFTGTFTWADPMYGINYVFLSNRVYPDARNKKIQEMNIRSDIQKVIYEAVLKAGR